MVGFKGAVLATMFLQRVSAQVLKEPLTNKVEKMAVVGGLGLGLVVVWVLYTIWAYNSSDIANDMASGSYMKMSRRKRAISSTGPGLLSQFNVQIGATGGVGKAGRVGVAAGVGIMGGTSRSRRL